MNQYKCELLLLLLLSLSSLSVVIFFLYHIHIFFFLCFRGSFHEEWTLLCSPVKATASKPKTTPGLIPFSAEHPDLASTEEWLMHDGWGQAQIPEGRGKVVRFLWANITAVLNYHKQLLAARLIRNSKSNHLGNLILLLKLSRQEDPVLPIPRVKSGKVPGGKPQALAIMVTMGITAVVLNQKGFTPHQLFGNDSYLWLSQPKGVCLLTQGLVQGCIKHLHRRAPKQKNYPTSNVNSAKVKKSLTRDPEAHTLKTLVKREMAVPSEIGHLEGLQLHHRRADRI